VAGVLVVHLLRLIDRIEEPDDVRGAERLARLDLPPAELIYN
jgi:hypothetical protein